MKNRDLKKEILDLIPQRLSLILDKALPDFDSDNPEEIRIFKKGAVVICCENKNLYLTKNHAFSDTGKAFTTDDKIIEDMIDIITDSSEYAYRSTIDNGYYTAKGGHRVGFAGEITYTNNTHRFKEFSSAYIRISKECKVKSNINFKDITEWGTTAVISPPKCGKTTFLREISHILSSDCLKSVCVIDEKNEICACHKGIPFYSTGINTGIISGMQKSEAIPMAVRNISPEFIICDEITDRKEADAVKNAIISGVDVIYSIHGNDTDVILKKEYMSILKNYTNTFIVLSNRNGPGTIEKTERNNICI